jgi:uncharacterized membrane protein YukC
MNIKNARHPRDIVITCYICDDQYTGDRIVAHLEECKYDWNIEEIDKPENERIPLPRPPSEFTQLYEAVKDLIQKASQSSDGNSEEGEQAEDEEAEEDEEGESEEEEDEEEDEKEEDKGDEVYEGLIEKENTDDNEEKLTS